ncbi:MAG: hypothetical protein CL663_03490 [Bacteroidetes bacterium]|nr:hypothetical protein [Bacteroidota bacterium]
MRKSLLILCLLAFASCSAPLFITKRNIELYPIEENGKIGFIDQKGKVRIDPKYLPCDYDDILTECSSDFNGNSYAVVKEQGGYTIIDWKGNKTIDYYFDELIEEFDGTYSAGMDGKYGLIDHSGNVLVPFIFDSQYFINDNEFFPGKIDAKAVIFYAEDSIIYMPYDYISPFFEGFACVKNNYKEGMINSSLELVIDTIYQELGFLSSGLINAKIENQWCFLNTQGQIVFNSTFEEASDFNDGIAVVKKEKYGAIDTLGNQIIPFEYEYLSYEGEANNGDKIFQYSDKENYFSYGARSGLINQSRDTLLKADFYELYYFWDIVEAGKYDEGVGVINLKNGKTIIPFNFDEIQYYQDALSVLYFSDEDGKEFYGYLKKRNKIIWSNNVDLMKKLLIDKTSEPN